MTDRESDQLRNTIAALSLPNAVRQARLGRVVRWRYYRENPHRRAGIAQAAAMNRKRRGDDVVTESGPTLVEWLTNRLEGRSESAVKVLLARGSNVPVPVLKALARGEDIKAAGTLLDTLVAAYRKAKGTPVDWERIVEDHVNGPPPPLPDQSALMTTRVQLMCADSRDLLTELVAKGYLFDCICVDPPYGITRRGAAGEMADDREGSLWAVAPLAKLIKPGRALCLWTSRGVVGKWAKALLDAGLIISDLVVWDKMDQHSKLRTDEMMLVASLEQLPVTFNDDTAKTWKLATLPNMHPLRDHPSPKPPQLMQRALARYTQPSDLVLDAFMGTAPVGVAAVGMGRGFIGYEAAPEFFRLGKAEVINALVDVGERVPGARSRSVA